MVSLCPAGAELAAVVFPGHAAASLVGRRVRMVAGYGGLGLRSFTPASMGLCSMFVARDVKASCKKAHKSGGSDQEIDLVEKLEEMWTKMPPTPRAYFVSMTDDELAVLEALESVANKGYSLVKDVAGRLRPAAGTRLFKDLFSIGESFATMVIRPAGSPVGLSSMLVRRLDDLRRVVSSACDAPLPRTVDLVPGPNIPMENTLDSEIVLVVEYFCNSVEADVTAMISTCY